MTAEETTKVLERTGALLTGHFQLSSGLHSDRYIQSALALAHPAEAEHLGRALADLLADANPTIVSGPALGGLIIAHEVARALKLPMLFTERDPESRKMALRRGFTVKSGDRVVMVEDVVTTGGSVAEAGEIFTRQGAEVVGYGCIVDRTGGAILPWGTPATALLTLSLAAWKPEACPLCKAGSAPVKPGSRPKPA